MKLLLINEIAQFLLKSPSGRNKRKDTHTHKQKEKRKFFGFVFNENSPFFSLGS